MKIAFLLRFCFILIFCYIILFSISNKTLAVSEQLSATNFSEDRIIIKFVEGKENKLAEILKDKQFRLLNKIFDERTFTLNVPRGQVLRYQLLISKLPYIDYAEPDYKVDLYELSNDPGIVENKQWGMFTIQTASSSASAWNISHGDPSIKVAVLDTGIDQDHSDVSPKIVVNHNFSDSNSFDDLLGHGTHVAGIIAAITNNDLGVAGVGYDISLMNVKVLNDSGVGYYSWLADGIKWAADNNAKVINMSLGGSSSSRTLQNAINYAWQKGVVISCAAGNSGSQKRSYPAYYSNCIAVASTNNADKKSSFSSYGYSWVDVASPGENIYSTLPNHNNGFNMLDYGYLSGTSMATPYVAGLAGLIYSVNPVLTNSSVRSYLEKNADKIAGTGSYWKWGRINAYKSVVSAVPTPIP